MSRPLWTALLFCSVFSVKFADLREIYLFSCSFCRILVISLWLLALKQAREAIPVRLLQRIYLPAWRAKKDEVRTINIKIKIKYRRLCNLCGDAYTALSYILRTDTSSVYLRFQYRFVSESLYVKILRVCAQFVRARGFLLNMLIKFVNCLKFILLNAD